MCGIIAASAITDVQDEVVAALARVQYRGYDSFGFAWVSEQGGLASARSTDPDAVHETCLPLSRTVLGHTRWATHGEVNLVNCHPHMSLDGDFALVHNGIVTNFEALRGADLSFESDSRLIVELLQKQLQSCASRLEGFRQVTNLLEGRNTIVVLFADGEILAFRQGSPLVVSKSENDDLYLASDQLAFSATCPEYCRIADGEFVQIRAHDLVLYSNELIARPQDWRPITERYQASDKDGYKHFMLKEVMEQWQTVPAVLNTLEAAAFPKAVTLLQSARRIMVVGAGGAYFTGRQIAWLLRNKAGLDAIAVPSYEYDSFATLLGKEDVLLAVSQSGETADTLQAIERAKQASVAVLSIINVPGSSMAELSDICLQQHSGAEVCVLSTKSATAQITVGYALALLSGSAPPSTPADRQAQARQHIQGVSHALAEELNPTYLADCKRLAAQLAFHPSLYVLGRDDYHAVAQVAALNIKEASYVHAEAFSAGELKHGVLALITRGVPVLVYVGRGDVFMRQVIAEVKTRGAWVIGLLADDACESICDESLRLPAEGSTLSSLLPGQLLAYFMALALARNPDRPRNLAKSITVL
ncbi:MAG: glucosamine--fructose-6-phosphate aminotransferase (isomerizing) [Candidatus Azotimanducaceae bacterium]|jgi:glucosamine--fructose-6-phosphate aminotransferase (isomerizing)